MQSGGGEGWMIRDIHESGIILKRQKESFSCDIITWKKNFCQCRVSKSMLLPAGGF
jgi:hypothetical protein